MSISSKKALEAAKVIVDFCNEQKGCQNCIFRLYGADHWKCNIEAFDLREVLWNIESKKKKITERKGKAKISEPPCQRGGQA